MDLCDVYRRESLFGGDGLVAKAPSRDSGGVVKNRPGIRVGSVSLLRVESRINMAGSRFESGLVRVAEF